jgi:hypothetical protein
MKQSEHFEYIEEHAFAGKQWKAHDSNSKEEYKQLLAPVWMCTKGKIFTLLGR